MKIKPEAFLTYSNLVIENVLKQNSESSPQMAIGARVPYFSGEDIDATLCVYCLSQKSAAVLASMLKALSEVGDADHLLPIQRFPLSAFSAKAVAVDAEEVEDLSPKFGDENGFQDMLDGKNETTRSSFEPDENYIQLDAAHQCVTFYLEESQYGDYAMFSVSMEELESIADGPTYVPGPKS